MAELRITCPHCNQDITCDELWVGHELQCPICQGSFTVPAPAQGGAGAQPSLVPKPPAGGKSRLSVGQAQVPAQTGNRNIPIRTLTEAPKPKKSPLVSVLVGVLIVAALGVGGYFGFGYIKSIQDKNKAKSATEQRNSDGGQVGHIADLNNVLNATEPGGAGLASLGSTAGRAGRRAQQLAGGDPSAAGAGPAGPVTAPKYTLDISQATIPEGRVNGTVSGTNFVAETVRIDTVGPAKVLRLFQGEMTSPDREMLVYLTLKSGEKLGGQSLVVTNGMRGAPQVAKRWKPGPYYPPAIKTFSSGYAMKLDLGHPTNDTVSGKIFLALPDPEQSVIAGNFTASIHQPDPNMQPVQYTAPVAAPTTPNRATPGRATMDQRYGIRR